MKKVFRFQQFEGSIVITTKPSEVEMTTNVTGDSSNDMGRRRHLPSLSIHSPQ